MIVEMTRYDFLLYHRDVPQFLESLRELGLVDVTLKDFVPTESQLSSIELAAKYSKVAQDMAAVKPAKEVADAEPFASVGQAVEEFLAAKAEIQTLEAAKLRANQEIAQLKVWGDFKASQIDELKAQGVTLRFFEASAKAFSDEWAAVYPLEVISSTSSQVYFVVVATDEEFAQGKLDIAATELPAPQSSESDKREEIEDAEARQAHLQGVIQRAALLKDEVKQQALVLSDQINFEKVRTSTSEEADGAIKIMEGWSESSVQAQIEEFADAHGAIYIAEKPTIEQNPPVKLKNNFFSKLYEPIGDLYMLPRYNELDLTPFFAPFFMIFFGMCFADAGYGVVLMLATILMWKKIPEGMKGFGWLSIFMNFSAVIFGLLTGNMFGVELVKVPALVEFKEFVLTPNDVFYLSVCIGAFQIIFGMFIKVFNRIKRGGSFVYGLSTIGWLCVILSSVVALSGVGGEVFASDSIAYYSALGLGLALILFFTVPHKPVASIGSGLYSIYETATGLVGDLISYVRLFAIGLAGTVIAQVFNELSVGLSGDIPVLSPIFMIIILAIGHGMNVFISILGAIVHPIRLTFVEFYKNADFDGGGRRFTPFKRAAKEEN